MNKLVLGLTLILLAGFALADLPVHCLYATTKGTWRYELTDQTSDSSIVKKCDIRSEITATQKMEINLAVPNIASDAASGNKGTWTLIYDQGFEVIINNNKYFAFFNYTMDGSKVVSNCERTFTGTFLFF
jgi:cathepsin C